MRLQAALRASSGKAHPCEEGEWLASTEQDAAVRGGEAERHTLHADVRVVLDAVGCPADAQATVFVKTSNGDLHQAHTRPHALVNPT